MMNNSSNQNQRKLKKYLNSPQKYVVTETQKNITSRAVVPQTQLPLNTLTKPYTQNSNTKIQQHEYTSPQSYKISSGQSLIRGTYSLQKLGLIYEGTLLNNKFHGDGILYQQHSIARNRYVYKGAWTNGARNGFGHYIYPDGSEYKGDWRNNMKDGQGTYSSTRGQIYQGQWAQNQRHGNGRLQLSNRVSLQGIWQNDKFVSGKVQYPNGSTYQGQIKQYTRHGQGIYIYPNKSKHTGQWVNNMKHGNGQYYFSNGDEYRGGFRQNLKDGNNCRYIWREGGYEMVDGQFLRDVYQNGNVIQINNKI